jgi:hypothetical protein
LTKAKIFRIITLRKKIKGVKMRIKTIIIGNNPDTNFIVWVMKTHTGVKYICNGFELSCSTRDKKEVIEGFENYCDFDNCYNECDELREELVEELKIAECLGIAISSLKEEVEDGKAVIIDGGCGEVVEMFWGGDCDFNKNKAIEVAQDYEDLALALAEKEGWKVIEINNCKAVAN